MVDTNQLLFDDCSPELETSTGMVQQIGTTPATVAGLSNGLALFEATPMNTYELLRSPPSTISLVGLTTPTLTDELANGGPNGGIVSAVSKSSSTESEYGGTEPGCSTRLLDKDQCDIKIVQQPRLCACPPSPFAFNSMRTAHVPVFFRPLEVAFVHWNWPAIRLFFLVVFCGSLFAMVCVVLGLLLTVKNDCVSRKDWWKGVVMYEIFPASFQDTDGDGFGDMNGVLQRLEYIESLGVSAVRFNSIFSALDYPLEYEHVIDFQNVDPHLGRIEHFERVVRELHRRGIRVVLDINPTVTSDQHTWAAHWLLNNFPEYEGFYINTTESYDEFYPPIGKVDVIDLELPQRIFGSQIFLNWTNREVQREMANIFRFWFHKGVDGFYFKHLERMKVGDDRELLTVLSQWRHIADHFSRENGKGCTQRLLMCSMSFFESLRNRDSLLLPALAEIFDLVDVPLDLTINATSDVETRLRAAEDWTSRLTTFPRINWNVGSSETFRLASRMIPGYNMAALFLLLSMPGTATIYYGDEIQLQDSFDEVTQKVFRSGQLCPMQWSNNPNGNFTKKESQPWLPIHPDFRSNNVNNLTTDLDDLSSFIRLRNKSYPLIANRFPVTPGASNAVNASHWPRRMNHNLLYNTDGLIALERFYPRHPRVVVCVNLGDSVREMDLSGEFHEAQVKLSTGTSINHERFNRLNLNPGEALVAEILE